MLTDKKISDIYFASSTSPDSPSEAVEIVVRSRLVAPVKQKHFLCS